MVHPVQPFSLTQEFSMLSCLGLFIPPLKSTCYGNRQMLGRNKRCTLAHENAGHMAVISRNCYWVDTSIPADTKWKESSCSNSTHSLMGDRHGADHQRKPQVLPTEHKKEACLGCGNSMVSIWKDRRNALEQHRPS